MWWLRRLGKELIYWSVAGSIFYWYVYKPDQDKKLGTSLSPKRLSERVGKGKRVDDDEEREEKQQQIVGVSSST